MLDPLRRKQLYPQLHKNQSPVVRRLYSSLSCSGRPRSPDDDTHPAARRYALHVFSYVSFSTRLQSVLRRILSFVCGRVSLHLVALPLPVALRVWYRCESDLVVSPPSVSIAGIRVLYV